MSTRIESQRLIDTREGYRLLHAAWTCFQQAGAIHTAARLKACLSSAAGAVRHAEGLNCRGEEEVAAMRKIRVHRRRP